MAVAYLRRNARQPPSGQRKEDDGGEVGIVRTVGFWGLASQFFCEAKAITCHTTVHMFQVHHLDTHRPRPLEPLTKAYLTSHITRHP